MAGSTDSTDFPATTRTGQRGSGSLAAYIAKFDATGSNLLFATYLTGTTGTAITGVALDGTGNILIAGTGAFNPTTGAYTQPGPTGFVTKLTPAADKILFTAVFAADPTALALDSKGAIYVTGSAGAAFKTTTGVVQPATGGGQCFSFAEGNIPCPDAFVLKLSSDGRPGRVCHLPRRQCRGHRPRHCGRFGRRRLYRRRYGVPQFPDHARSAPARFRRRRRRRFPELRRCVRRQARCGGRQPGLSTFLGGAAPDIAYAIAVDQNGSAYGGGTQSSNFPTTPGALQTKYAGGTPVSDTSDPAGDAFVVKYSAGGAVQWSALLGGSLDDAG